MKFLWKYSNTNSYETIRWFSKTYCRSFVCECGRRGVLTLDWGLSQNFRSNFFATICVWVDAVLHGLSANRIERVGDEYYDALLASTLSKTVLPEDESSRMLRVSHNRSLSSPSYLYVSLVEESFLYRLLQTAPQTDNLALRKGENTKKWNLSQNEDLSTGMFTVLTITPQRFSRKVWFFYHRLFKPLAIEWQQQIEN